MSFPSRVKCLILTNKCLVTFSRSSGEATSLYARRKRAAWIVLGGVPFQLILMFTTQSQYVKSSEIRILTSRFSGQTPNIGNLSTCLMISFTREGCKPAHQKVALAFNRHRWPVLFAGADPLGNEIYQDELSHPRCAHYASKKKLELISVRSLIHKDYCSRDRVPNRYSIFRDI